MKIVNRRFPKSVQAGKPRLSKLKSNWSRLLIGDLFYSASRPLKLENEINYNLVTIKRSRGGVILRGIKKGNEIAVRNQFIVREGDFLISKRQIVHGACGFVTKEMDGAIVSNEYSILKCSDKIIPLFLNCLIYSVYFQQTCFHSSMGIHIEKMIFKLNAWYKWKINIPSIKEQEQFGTFILSVDTKINQLTKKKNLLEQYKKGIMKKLFSQEIRFKADDGGDYPDWVEKKLIDISVKKSSNISANTIRENNGDYKIYGASGYLQNVNFYREEKPYISMVKDGAGVGRTRLCEAKSSVLGTIDIIKPIIPNNLNFLYSLINQINFNKYITGSTIPHIYFKDYSQEKIKTPIPKEQQKIANFLSSIDNKISKTTQQLTQTQQFKKALLQKMFV